MAVVSEELRELKVGEPVKVLLACVLLDGVVEQAKNEYDMLLVRAVGYTYPQRVYHSYVARPCEADRLLAEIDRSERLLGQAREKIVALKGAAQ